MSDPFSQINNQLTSVGQSARDKAAQKALEAKQKVFKTKKSIEEGLSGFKAIASVKKIGGAFEKNLSPYIKQEVKAGWNEFKDKWSNELKSRAEGYVKKTAQRLTGQGEDEGEDLAQDEVADVADDAPVAPSLGSSPAAAAESSIAAKAVPESDVTDILPSEIGEATATKVGTTINPFNPGGELFDSPALKGQIANKLDPIAEDSVGELSAEVRAGLQGLKTQQAAINDGISRLGNAYRTATPGNSAADEASDAAKAAEKLAGEQADKALAEKLAAKTTEKAAAEDTAEITSEEAIGGLLDDTGVLAPIGLILGAVGLGTAAEDAKKKLPKMNPLASLGDQVGGSAFQSGIN